MADAKISLLQQQGDGLIKILKSRFMQNISRHGGIEWEEVRIRLEASPEKWEPLSAMEETGGEPDVVEFDHKTGEFVFYDCSAESPAGRRNLCYDLQALKTRKSGAPSGSAAEMAQQIGIQMLTEAQYRHLQELGRFDQKTSSWVKTPLVIRNLGGALFCDRRYDHVFVYHNGAQSYYSSRGFRGSLRV